MAHGHLSDRRLTRRGFLGVGVAGGGVVLLGDRLARGAEEKTDVWVLHGTDKKKLMNAAMKVISENGGLGKDVKKLTLKVNAAWWRTPEQGANTHPELVDAFLKGCKERGVKELVIPENPCHSAKRTFAKSGLLAVAKSNGVAMIDLKSDRKLFKETAIPKGKRLKTASVARHFLETDALVNMPVAKHHGSAILTCAMKNWMGSVWDRRYWHRNSLHQCIADYCTFIKPAWTVVDATRIMLDRGPIGPSKNLKKPDLLIVSKDQVAADAYASTLFRGALPLEKIEYLKIAGQMKVGTADLSKIAVHKIEVT